VDLLAAGGTAADLYPHDPAAMMIYCSPVTYEQGSAADPEHTLAPAYRCPQFAAMVLRACGGDQTVATYLIMALGYALLGYNPHQLCFFLTGPTGNGKSKILSIVSTVMGPALAYEAETPLLARVKDRHPRHAATMRGKRLITMSETNQALYLDEMQLKRLTGEDYISVELLYEQTMTRTQVSWVIFIGNNMMPSLLHLDAALRRRIVVIPMSGVSVPEWERDEGLAARIVAEEAAGIAALLVWGCRAAMAKPGGLTDLPVAVAAATAQYAAEQNIAARWVSERCVLRTDGPAVAGADCYRSMRQWCRPEEDPGRNSFYEMLAEVPGVRRVPGDGEHAVWFTGCEIKRDWL
jgi:putative DNA primase/helicase